MIIKTIAGREIRMNLSNFFLGIYEMLKYVLKFWFLMGIAWLTSLIFPIKVFPAGILLMTYWFLNLYYSPKK